jgi:hypothetical protein
MFGLAGLLLQHSTPVYTVATNLMVSPAAHHLTVQAFCVLPDGSLEPIVVKADRKIKPIIPHKNY